MEKVENSLLELWRGIRDKITITITDLDELDRGFTNTFLKIQGQRQRLEESRDMWKKKYMEAKK